MELAVMPEDDGSRLDRFLRRQLPHFNQGIIERALRQGDIRVGGRKVKSNHRVVENERITIQDRLIAMSPPSPDKPTVPQAPQIDPRLAHDQLEKMEVARTADWIAYNKPTGLAVQGGTATKRHLDGLLGAAFGENRPRLVHRIDKDTSGLLLVARTLASARALTEAFRTHEISKSYIALVTGDTSERGVCDAAVIKAGAAGQEKMMIDEKAGQQAQRRYLRLEKAGRVSLMALQPITGRTHQLRVHMAHLGCPILGDRKYGASPVDGFAKKLHLHAQFMRLPDGTILSAPITDASAAHFATAIEILSWAALIPQQMPRFSVKKKH